MEQEAGGAETRETEFPSSTNAKLPLKLEIANR